MASDEEDLAALRQKASAFMGPARTAAEIAQEQKEWDDSNILNVRFPDRDGAEIAQLELNGDIHVNFSSSTQGLNTHGEQTFTPEDKQYDEMRRRHRIDQWQGRMHYIAKRWNAEKNEWIDLGDGWLD